MVKKIDLMNLSIKFIIGSLDVGGAERHLVQMLPALKANGLKVSVIVLSDKVKLKSILDKAGVKVNVGLNLKFLPRLLRRPLRLMLSLSTLVKDFIFDRRSIRHAFLPEAYLLTSLAARVTFSNAPLIMSRRCLNNYQLRRPILAKLEKNLNKFTRFALGNSKAVVNQLYEEGFLYEKVGLIYNGIDTQPYLQSKPKEILRSKLNLPPESLLIVIVANLIPYKGHNDLLKALSIIKEQINVPWQLLCVGSDSNILKNLKELATQFGIAENIKFLGARSDTIEIISASDIGVLCSHEEGFSNAILEKMAAGLPMVVTDVGGNAEAVADMQNGFVVPSKNPELLAQSLLTIILSSNLREKYGALSRERVQQHFSLDKCINSYIQLYKNL